jgi:uncharacterized tellurite resistance protein B-like protein
LLLFDAIFKKLGERDAAPPGPSDLQVAVAVLLIEAARMDDTFDADERAAIERLLAAKFELSPATTAKLMERAEAAAMQTAQIHPFTRLAVEKMPPEQRIRLIEMLWEVVYADGALDPEEDMLLRRVAGLIYISDHDRIAARQRVLARLSGKAKN